MRSIWIQGRSLAAPDSVILDPLRNRVEGVVTYSDPDNGVDVPRVNGFIDACHAEGLKVFHWTAPGLYTPPPEWDLRNAYDNLPRSWPNFSLEEARIWALSEAAARWRQYPALDGVAADYIRYPAAVAWEILTGGALSANDINALAQDMAGVAREMGLEFVASVFSASTTTVGRIATTNNERVGQDWPWWLEAGILDRAYVMWYVSDPERTPDGFEHAPENRERQYHLLMPSNLDVAGMWRILELDNELGIEPSYFDWDDIERDQKWGLLPLLQEPSAPVSREDFDALVARVAALEAGVNGLASTVAANRDTTNELESELARIFSWLGSWEGNNG